jgi:lysophospholipase L1-like esterase
MVQGRFQALFLGDSIVWGQGLREEHKFSTWIVQWLNEHHPDLRAFKTVKAHSGAIIGSAGDAAGDGDLSDRVSPGEIPSPYPTIHRQAASFSDNDPNDVDLIVLDGGINDVGIRVIFSTRTLQADLRSLIRYACGTSMTALLLAVAARFPNPKTKILVLGYYPILSSESHLPGITTSSSSARWNPWRRVVDNALLWKTYSDELIQQSIVNASVVHPGRFLWIEPGIQAENSAFAPRPWVFGVALPHISPEDDLAAIRRAQSALEPAPDGRVLSARASAGHPNRWGARAYFNAIYPVLQREYGL